MKRWWLRAFGLFVGLPLLVLAVADVYLGFSAFEIPAARLAPDVLVPSRPSSLKLRYTGVSGYELTDGETVVLLDPVITRPTVNRLVTGPIEVDEAQVAAVFPKADYILVNHAHYDHGVDAPAIAVRTGATVVGSRSMVNLARSRGVPADKTIEVEGGETLQLGPFEVRVAPGDHAPLLGMTFLMRGQIEPDAGRLWFFQYTQDVTFAFHLTHPQGTLLFHPQSGFVGEQLPPADTVIFGVAGYPATKPKIDRIVAHSQPKVLLPTHYDNFFQPRERGMAWLPVVDYDSTVVALDACGQRADWWFLDYDRPVTLPGTSTTTSTTAGR